MKKSKEQRQKEMSENSIPDDGKWRKYIEKSNEASIVIFHTSPAQLAKARGKLQAHSTRDKPKFIKQLDHVIETFRNLGYEIVLKKKRGQKIEQKDDSPQ